MPALGDQYKSNGSATANPFEETKPRVTEFTAQEIATLQSRLDKQLGPEYISSRPGAAGQKVYYLAAEKVINLANDVFGFNGWSSAIQNIQIDFVDENPQNGKISLGLSVVVRVTLRDGAYHEDVGYGHIENCKGKAAAFEKAKKEGATDALKRALRTFGNILGNCMYDKDYLTKVSKVKVGAGKWDPNALHRHPDFVPKKESEETTNGTSAMSTEPTSVQFEESFDLGEFDDDTFDADDFEQPNETISPSDAVNQPNPPDSNLGPPNHMRSLVNDAIHTPRKIENGMMAPPAHPMAAMPQNNQQKRVLSPGMEDSPEPSRNKQLIARQQPGPQRNPIQDGQFHSVSAMPLKEQSGTLSHDDQSDLDAESPAFSTDFYSARAISKAVEIEVKLEGPSIATRFDSGAESPSIRKTEGVERTKTIPISKNFKMGPGATNKVSADSKPDAGVRVGVPGQIGQNPAGKSPSVSAYRPPTKRGLELAGVPSINAGLVMNGGGGDRTLVAAKRSPLVDVSNLQHVVTARAVDGVEAKRQRVTDAGGSNMHGVHHRSDTIRPG